MEDVTAEAEHLAAARRRVDEVDDERRDEHVERDAPADLTQSISTVAYITSIIRCAR
jgi:hypothetical protein